MSKHNDPTNEEESSLSLVDLRFFSTVSPKGRCCQVVPNSSCAQLNSLWKHVSICSRKPSKSTECEICESLPNYGRYRNVLKHYRHCRNTSCGYCGPVMETLSTPDHWSNRIRQIKISKLLLQMQQEDQENVFGDKKNNDYLCKPASSSFSAKTAAVPPLSERNLSPTRQTMREQQSRKRFSASLRLLNCHNNTENSNDREQTNVPTKDGDLPRVSNQVLHDIII